MTDRKHIRIVPRDEERNMIANRCSPGEKPDATQRRCYDCGHLKGAVSWWCTSEGAIAARGTSIPGIRDCRFWVPSNEERADFFARSRTSVAEQVASSRKLHLADRAFLAFLRGVAWVGKMLGRKGP